MALSPIPLRFPSRRGFTHASPGTPRTTMGDSEGGSALAVRDVVKRYGATVALDGVTFDITAGSAHALIGENGAGKSTLVKIVSGITRPDAGEIEVFGQTMRRIATPAKAAELGIGTAFQELSLVPTLTVADNLLLGIEPHSPRELHRQAQQLLDACDVPDVSPDWRVEDLTLPERQMVEIAKAVRHEPRLLFLDESTSALGEGAADWFRNLLSKLRDRNTTLVFITHRLGEVREHCDHATVLRNGEAVGELTIDEADEDEVVKMMIGRSMDQAFPDRRRASGPPRQAQDQRPRPSRGLPRRRPRTQRRRDPRRRRPRRPGPARALPQPLRRAALGQRRDPHRRPPGADPLTARRHRLAPRHLAGPRGPQDRGPVPRPVHRHQHGHPVARPAGQPRLDQRTPPSQPRQ